MRGTNVVIGAGAGGLAAALALHQRGEAVLVLEARDAAGGLASSFEVDGKRHDGGPYILLDRPGLVWAFERLGLRLQDEVELIELDEVYRVEREDGPTVCVYRDLDRTAEGFDALFPGSGDRYRQYVATMTERYERLAPLQRAPFGGPLGLLGGGRWRDLRFLLGGFESAIRPHGLPPAVVDALGIWTRVAGQPLQDAPAPLALVPAVVHSVGAYTVRGGMGRIVEALAAAVERAGIEIRYGARVDAILHDGGRVCGVRVGEERIDALRAVSNAPGISTLATLLSPKLSAAADEVSDLPLQSPGVAAYLEAEIEERVPFLRFRLGAKGCRALLSPGAVDETRRGTARLFAPTDQAWADGTPEEAQEARLDGLLAEPWWREGLTEPRVVARRVPRSWGRAFGLWRDSMNPTMTAAFMRRGRLPHDVGELEGLYLCGAATHPGQWVSFCAISGILAADAALGA